MKILYIYDKLPGNYQNYLLLLLENIRRKVNLKVLTYGRSAISNHEISNYKLKDNFQRLFYKIGLSTYKSSDVKVMSNYDILHLQHSYLIEKLVPLRGFKNRPKIIVTLRGADTYMKPWASERWRKIYSQSEGLVDSFITMSQHQRDYLMKWGVAASSISVVPISFGFKNENKPKFPGSDCLRLVSAFRMTWEKNIEGTLRFAEHLKLKKINFIFDIYGDGDDIYQLYYLIDKYKLAEFVKVKGQVPNNQLKLELPKYDFFVQLSLSEALPTSVIEAQSVGLPCIVSDSDGLPEAVIANKSAVVADYHMIDYFVEECLRIWKDRDLYYSYSKCAIENANENFSIEKETERLISLYQSLTNKK